MESADLGVLQHASEASGNVPRSTVAPASAATVIDATRARGESHPLHSHACDWPEKNCYADLWIEALHALELQPCAMLGHTLPVGFQDDQWTFFKPCASELRDLYGIEVHEMTVWRSLEAHSLEHLPRARLVCTEADAFWLPDTAATDYRRQHTKTTILVNAIDPRAQKLGYFHNAGYFELDGDDYVNLLRTPQQPLPLFAELVHIGSCTRREPLDLARRAFALLRAHYEWRPAANPFERFGERYAHDLPEIAQRGLEYYHAWAFAGLRQAGSAFELAAAHLRWLAKFDPAFDGAAQPFSAISSGAKSLLLKGARAAATRKAFDVRESVRPMARAWATGMARLGDALAHARLPREQEVQRDG
jgi:hypothetical protein